MKEKVCRDFLLLLLLLQQSQRFLKLIFESLFNHVVTQSLIVVSLGEHEVYVVNEIL